MRRQAPNSYRSSRCNFSLTSSHSAASSGGFFISVITGDYETMSAQSLILLGIAGGTGMGAMAIDFDKTGKAASSASRG